MANLGHPGSPRKFILAALPNSLKGLPWIGFGGTVATQEIHSYMKTATPQVRAGVAEEQMLAIVRELLTELGSRKVAEAVSLNSSFDRDLGLGSLERVELLVRCEARFNTRLRDGIAQQSETPADWVRAMLEGEKATGPESGYRIVQPDQLPPPPPRSVTTIAEVLRRHTELVPARVHIHLLEEVGGQDITYGQLLETALGVAAGLAASGLRRDETVAIMLPTCSDFFYAFFGVMLAGGIAVPIYPPARPDKVEEYVKRQIAILRNAEVRFLISFKQANPVSKIMRLGLPSLLEVTTVQSLRERGAHSPLPAVVPSDTAFIQYTSGSTGDPKGVVLSQANILANVRGIGWAVKVHPRDVVVSWLPLYHDMGLIGSWLFSVFYALPITIFSPLAFLSRPERWLWALHDSGGTLCPAPNFSYELCARKTPESALEGLDLSAWRVAINAGEAVLPDTLSRFEQRFRPYGFRPESYVPCYGLAESSVALVFPSMNRRPVIDTIRRGRFENERVAEPAGPEEPDRMRFVANGSALPDHEVRIVNDEGREAGERTQGRIFFRGPSMTSGYYRNPEATAAVTTEDGWMDSGDLGYWADGELYITGRVKDCIIKSGRNISPLEVETVTAEVSGVRPGCIAAFGTVDEITGTERLIVAAETRSTLQEELSRIRAEIVQRVEATLGIPPDRVLLLEPHSIPKTSSGKIRRNETRVLYETERLYAGKTAPWVQIVRLGWQNLRAWRDLVLRQIRTQASALYNHAILNWGGIACGLLVRAMPGGKRKAKVVQGATRFLCRIHGRGVTVQGDETSLSGTASVLVANRQCSLDPFLLSAVFRSPTKLADGNALADLPFAVAFLLSPLVIPPLEEALVPPGGTPRQRIRAALEEGFSVISFPDGPVGMPGHQSRFRLDGFHAALELSLPVFPIGIRETQSFLRPGNVSEKQESPNISIGEPIRVEPGKSVRPQDVREKVREALRNLC